MGDPVSEFYTTHPYPPPVANLDRARDEWRDANRHRAEHHLLWPGTPYRADLDILIAGCGTWQAAKYALCRPAAHVVGIDVSTTSLDHTEQLKRKYALTNLQTRHVSIESVEALGQQFDLIVCTGVLHHLVDPVVGLRALRSVLKPDGRLYLMVYAPYGRTGIAMLQEYCRTLGVGRSDGEIADLRAAVAALPPQHPLHTELATSRDAQNVDALADALLNPRDQSYSVPELFDFIARGGVRFTRWYFQAQYLPECGAFAATSHASRVARLRPREQYAAMELWRETMGAHSVVVSRDEVPDADVNVRFNDQRWSSFVPIRLAYTMCVEERLPQGAAAVLLNRSHQHRDLLLTITPPEKQMFDAIDGQRTIAEIAVHAGLKSAADCAKTFVEKLWRYDQVVFDTSGATSSRDLR
ncbi:MAG TPA: class I SAM-dependent methyltransferase [Vicinamibacterales bacterium]